MRPLSAALCLFIFAIATPTAEARTSDCRTYVCHYWSNDKCMDFSCYEDAPSDRYYDRRTSQNFDPYFYSSSSFSHYDRYIRSPNYSAHYNRYRRYRPDTWTPKRRTIRYETPKTRRSTYRKTTGVNININFNFNNYNYQ